MIEEPGRSRDDDARKTVPEEIAANGHIRDDGDGRDDDLRPYSKERVRITTLKGVEELLANPPGWLRRQVEKHLEDPREGTLRALCAVVANAALGNPRRGEEVRPAVEKMLKEGRIVT